MTDTILTITPFGLVPYSARGLSQTLEPIDQSKQMRRTVNGALRDLSVPQFQKYQSEITCTDQQAAAFDGVWPGQQVVVECAKELAYKTAGGVPFKDVVDGSTRVVGAYTYYRPRLTMRVIEFKQQFDEWEHVESWSLSLEEV